ncbi:DUF262 domain-containing protein [Xylanibacter ruminicola]|uniref:DUF262 domain-containing protein n=1 Tax=Xylanibacter ruminicola TaxID=839 RepID=A0A1M6UGE4_XYLRU|nr:DUF262 domain-containing protein [Xylanibacter ruminicola]SHK68241.1 Protein of unknown function [Xylanibacter ruminicola]
MKTNKISELHILEGDSTIFKSVRYSIPLYQRDYAWEEKQIVQLIEDIDDVNLKDNYYIGSLIVSNQEGVYEVVDGQQRLTTLFLLLSYLRIDTGDEDALSFSCREKSNYTLRHIIPILNDERDKYDADSLQQNIISGLNIIKETIEKFTDEHKVNFVRKLENIVLYRIEVPEHTDLNHYFEIMNTRGEQLEQSDVLKARLMSELLGSRKDQAIFSTIWDACRDMSCYVQMHFTTTLRGELFGWNWGQIPSHRLTDYRQLSLSSVSMSGSLISDIIRPNYAVDIEDGYLDDDTRVRFESIIEFPHFLLHVLKVYLALHPEIKHRDGDTLVYELLDDKKLISSFERILDYGVKDGKPINRSQFSRDFIICLLRTRYLFDKYIIKREYANESSDGEWSLKSLHVSGQQSNKRAYYANTCFRGYNQRELTHKWRHKHNLMLQSALRVSYTSPKVMHWITDLLIWLSSNVEELSTEIPNYTYKIDEIAKRPVREFLENQEYSLGVNTPHAVLNYLDFLLWKRDDNVDFTFEFRNSVEHWYPRNPSEGTFERWDDDVDRFGNLCLIQRNVNSRFSNMSPEAKKSTFKDMIKKGSLKLRIMSEKTQGVNASQQWKDTICAQHEQDMINLLTEDTISEEF